MLGQNNPLILVSGVPVDLNATLKEYNNAEFYYLMPRAFLKSISADMKTADCLANRCFLSRSENKHLGGVAPSVYRAKMAANVSDTLKSAMCSNSLFADQLDAFVKERTKLLAAHAHELVG